LHVGGYAGIQPPVEFAGGCILFSSKFLLLYLGFSQTEQTRLDGWLVSAQQLAVPLMATLGRKENLWTNQSLREALRQGWQETGTGT